jgi:putative transposase
VNGRFEWQQGFGAFSYGRSQMANVISYIQNQELHHQKVTFLDEFKMLLSKFDVDYDDRYIFKHI